MDGLALALVGLSGASAMASVEVIARGKAPMRFGTKGGASADLGHALERVQSLGVVRELEKDSELSRRRAACLHEMPVLIDTLTLGLSSGLSFDASLELYCERFDTQLASAFSEAMLSWRIGASSREEALKGMARELGVPALSRFASVVSESLAFGTPLAAALESQAQALREEQRSDTEEQIEKASVKMLIPLGTLIVPAMLLAILGPLLSSAVTTVG
ncbi:MAG: type II secretion system F family protein [Tractidigestivibacter sp.]|jgi:tight adherence protein C|uniref:type II secretion system F family protein n=1 Tax=Tractidigestivibacter sp. TaxID=2847320 RepID=UPI003D8D4EAB